MYNIRLVAMEIIDDDVAETQKKETYNIRCVRCSAMTLVSSEPNRRLLFRTLSVRTL